MNEQRQSWPPAALGLKPVWIHDLLLLWRRNQLLSMLLERATDYTAHEIRSKPVRRAYIAAIAELFVETRGSGKQTRTLAQSVWATYSCNFPVTVLAPAYLVHLVTRWPLAYTLAARLGEGYTPGALLDTSTLLPHLDDAPAAGRPDERPDEQAAALGALLRTLQYFGVLAPARRGSRYVLAAPLPVAPPVFPLLVWVWWQQNEAASVDLAEFRRSPLFAFVETGDFAAGWESHPGKVWTLEPRAGGMWARLHPADRAGFVRVLLNLLSTGGQRGRNLPRESEPPPEAQSTFPAQHSRVQ